MSVDQGGFGAHAARIPVALTASISRITFVSGRGTCEMQVLGRKDRSTRGSRMDARATRGVPGAHESDRLPKLDRLLVLLPRSARSASPAWSSPRSAGA